METSAKINIPLINHPKGDGMEMIPVCLMTVPWQKAKLRAWTFLTVVSLCFMVGLLCIGIVLVLWGHDESDGGKALMLSVPASLPFLFFLSCALHYRKRKVLRGADFIQPPSRPMPPYLFTATAAGRRGLYSARLHRAILPPAFDDIFWVQPGLVLCGTSATTRRYFDTRGREIRVVPDAYTTAHIPLTTVNHTH